MMISRFGDDPPSIPAVKSESGVVQSSLKLRTWLFSAQDSLSPSKVQRGRVGIPGDFSVPAVRVAEITEGIYDLAPKIWSMRGFQSLRPPNPPKGLLLDT